MPSLSYMRDLLLPGVAYWGRGRNVDLVGDFTNDTLNIRVDDKSTVLLTRSEIDDGVWRTEFAPRLRNALGIKEND